MNNSITCKIGDHGRNDVIHKIIKRDQNRAGWTCACGYVLLPTDEMICNGFPAPKTKPDGTIIDEK